MTSAAIYTRVSSDEQIEGFSLDAQARACRSHCAERGWKVVAEYVEEGRSARTEDTRKRPEWTRMMRDATNKRFDVVVVHKLDRFSRHLRTTLDAFDRLSRAGIAFASVSEHIDYSSPSGRLFLTMLGGLAQWFSDNLSTETHKGKVERRQQGLHNGLLPFGYVSGGERSVALVDEHTARGVRLAFDLAADGATARKIADTLNAAGYRTTGNRGHNPWQRDSVRVLLANRFYLGELPGGVAGQHQPLVNVDLFDRVQAAVSARGYRVARVRDNAQRYSVTGLCVCGQCGSPMQAGLNGKVPRIICSGRRQRSECTQRSLTLLVVEEEVVNWLASLRLEPEDVAHAIREMSKERDKPNESETERRRLLGQLDRLKRLFLLGDIDETEYKSNRQTLQAQLAEIPNPQQDRIEIERTAILLRDLRAAWAGLSQSDRNRVLVATVEKIVLNETRIEVFPLPALVALSAPSMVIRKRRDSNTNDHPRYATHLGTSLAVLAEVAATASASNISAAARAHNVSRQTVRRALRLSLVSPPG